MQQTNNQYFQILSDYNSCVRQIADVSTWADISEAVTSVGRGLDMMRKND